MNGRARKALVVLPTIVTLALIVVAGVVILQQRQDRSNRLAEAERVGSVYFSEVATFQLDVRSALDKVKSGKPAALKRVVDRKLEQPPVLGPAPEGAEISKTYREAVRASATVLDPYTSLSDTLGRAVAAEEFLDAADKILAGGPTSLLGNSLVYDSGPLRSRVLPELNRRLAAFRAVQVPEGARPAAVAVESAVTYVISEITTMADRADQGRAYEFSYGSQYSDARQAVRDYATRIDGDVAEALDRIAGAKVV